MQYVRLHNPTKSPIPGVPPSPEDRDRLVDLQRRKHLRQKHTDGTMPLNAAERQELQALELKKKMATEPSYGNVTLRFAPTGHPGSIIQIRGDYGVRIKTLYSFLELLPRDKPNPNGIAAVAAPEPDSQMRQVFGVERLTDLEPWDKVLKRQVNAEMADASDLAGSATSMVGVVHGPAHPED